MSDTKTHARGTGRLVLAIAGSDLTALAALLCLLLVLAPHQAAQLSLSGGQRVFSDVIGEMTSWYLLPALGLVLVMRLGVIDLSVWMTMSLGAAIAAAIFGSGGWAAQQGIWPLAAALMVIVAGAASGAFSALLSNIARVPATIATAVTALGLWGLLNWLFAPLAQGRQILVGDMALQGLIAPGYTLLISRMLLVALAYSGVMLWMLAASAQPVGSIEQAAPPPPARPRRQLAISLIVSGALSAAGGFAWLMGNPAANIPTYPVGDLRVAAAALLTGAFVLRGPGRALLAGLLLPPAMLLATLWYQNVWCLPSVGPLAGDLLMLLGMVVVAQAAGFRLRRDATTLRLATWLLALAGLLLASLSAAAGRQHGLLFYAGSCTSAAAVLIMVWPAGERDSRSTG